LKLRTDWPLLLTLCLVALPSAAQTLYDNGPINGTNDAWTIDFGFTVSDTFLLSNASTVNGLSFGVWQNPLLTLQDADVQITSSEFGGTIYFDQLVTFTESGCVNNQYGFAVCTATSTNFTPLNLAAGTYWLNLSNAETQVGQDDPVYWDENSGPSFASENTLGTIPSESFTLYGSSSSGTTPEPGSIILVACGIVGVAGVRCRKLF
jgi:hypothetical protein